MALRCYDAMTATSQGDSHNATSGSTAWAKGSFIKREGGMGWGLIGSCRPAKYMPACLLGLFLDHHRQETLPSYSLVRV